MTRYSGIIERNTVTVPNEMEEEIRLKENTWPRDTFFKKSFIESIQVSSFFGFFKQKVWGKKS